MIRTTRRGAIIGGSTLAASQVIGMPAIAQAKKHIYVEDQYMVSLELAQAIAAAAPRLEFVCLLLAGDDMIDGELVAQGGWRRQEFLRVARSTGGRVWCFQSQTHFVHPKVWLFDDRFANLLVSCRLSVLTRNYDRINAFRTICFIFNRHLSFAIGTQKWEQTGFASLG